MSIVSYPVTSAPNACAGWGIKYPTTSPKTTVILPTVIYVQPFTSQYTASQCNSQAVQEILKPPYLNDGYCDGPVTVVVDIKGNYANWDTDTTQIRNNVATFYNENDETVGFIRQSYANKSKIVSTSNYPNRLVYNAEKFNLYLGYELNNPNIIKTYLVNGYVPIKKIVMGGNCLYRTRNGQIVSTTHNIFTDVQFNLTGYDDPYWKEKEEEERKKKQLKNRLVNVLDTKLNCIIPYYIER